PPSRQGACPLGVARQQAEEPLEAFAVIFEVRRELPEDRPQFLAEVEDARCKEIGERLFDIEESPHVRDVTASFEAEYKSLRCLRVPLRVAFRALQGIEGAVDLYGREAARRVLELGALRQIRRIERPAPGRVTPTRNADADPRHEPPAAGFAPEPGIVGFAAA